jgi:site-specific recombinase XerD
LKKRLATFCADFGDRPIAAITVEELDDWLRNLNCGPKSRANYRANVGVMFSYTKRRRVIDSNPVLRTAQPELIDKAPEIFSVDDLAALFNPATTRAPEVVPMLAIGAFAGVREAEIKRLKWSEVDQKRGHIEIKSSKSQVCTPQDY